MYWINPINRTSLHCLSNREQCLRSPLLTFHTPFPICSAVRFTAREDSRQIAISWTIPRADLKNYAIHITGKGQTLTVKPPIKINVTIGSRRESMTQCGIYEVKLVHSNSPIISQTVNVSLISEYDLIACVRVCGYGQLQQSHDE